MKERLMVYVMIALFSAELFGCTALPAQGHRLLQEDGTPFNSLSLVDVNRIDVIFCIKGQCNYGKGWHDCYCCGVPTAKSCHNTREDCRSKCPVCNPKCPLPPVKSAIGDQPLNATTKTAQLS
ncbi:hypothetical protein EJB05_15915 [Eragrostis curvula]|uniref:Embryo surrounding factor 1 brassicaceae domain-containing protein n=1 Tax=Eragrostis curvula TaxID=38414 RepID=A0A5J9VD79_9POAL|nr:hypothetical protein EJB05_15915 [Eragrostis curvula]